MADVKVTLHSLEPNGICALGGEEGEVYVLSFDDGTLTNGALCLKCRLMIENMKLRTPGAPSRKKPVPRKPEPVPTAQPVNGEAT